MCIYTVAGVSYYQEDVLDVERGDVMVIKKEQSEHDEDGYALGIYSKYNKKVGYIKKELKEEVLGKFYKDIKDISCTCSKVKESYSGRGMTGLLISV